MKILVTGAAGQIGSELTGVLRDRYGNQNVIASDINREAGKKIKSEGPFELGDCTQYDEMKKIIQNYGIDTIYHLAAILSAVAENRAENSRLKAVIGFAAETESLVANARDKLTRKRLDLIVANDVSSGESGFSVDTNRVTLIDSTGKANELPLLQKQEVAEIIIDRLIGLLQ